MEFGSTNFEYTPLLESPEVVCIATSRSAFDVGAWQAALNDAGIPFQVQTVSVREFRRHPRAVYLLYVSPADEQRATGLLRPRQDLPIFPLAHLRETSW